MKYLAPKRKKRARFSPGNYWKPTPKRWRVIGDSALYFSTASNTLIMGSPLSDYQKMWAIFIIGVFAIVLKVLSNFFKEDEDVNTGTDRYAAGISDPTDSSDS